MRSTLTANMAGRFSPKISALAAMPTKGVNIVNWLAVVADILLSTRLHAHTEIAAGPMQFQMRITQNDAVKCISACLSKMKAKTAKKRPANNNCQKDWLSTEECQRPNL